MADDDATTSGDATTPGAPEAGEHFVTSADGEGGGGRPRWLVPAVVAVIVLGVGGLAGALVIASGDDGGGDSDTAIGLDTVPTSSTTTTTTAPAASQGGSGSSGGGGSGSSGGGTKGGSGTQATVPAPAKPVFNSSSGPGQVSCGTIGAPVNIDISWSTSNATDVSISGEGGGFEPSGSATFSYACKATGSPGGVTITAHGPGGEASVNVSWTYFGAVGP